MSDENEVDVNLHTHWDGTEAERGIDDLKKKQSELARPVPTSQVRVPTPPAPPVSLAPKNSLTPEIVDLGAARAQHAALESTIADLYKIPAAARSALQLNQIAGSPLASHSWSSQLGQALRSRTELEGRFPELRPGQTPPELPKGSASKVPAAAAEDTVAQTRSALAKLLMGTSGVARATGLQGPVSSEISAMGTAVRGLGAGTAELAIGSFALVAAMGLTAKELAEGARNAAKMAKEMDGLSAAERAAKSDELGSLAGVLERNSALLLEYAHNSELAEGSMQGFFTAAGTGVIPALNEIDQAINSIDWSKLGEGFGDSVGGALSMTKQIAEATGVLKLLAEAEDVVTKNPKLAGSMIAALIPGMQLAPLLADMGADAKSKANKESQESLRKRLAGQNTTQLELQQGESDKYDVAGMLGSDERQHPISRAHFLNHLAAQTEDQVRSATNDDGTVMSGHDAEVKTKFSIMLRKQVHTLLDQISQELQDSDLQGSIDKATAFGDAPKVRALKAQQHMEGLLRAGDANAARDTAEWDAANVPQPGIRFSNLVSRGGSVGESLAGAAAAQGSHATEDSIQKLALLLKSSDDNGARLDALIAAFKQPEEFYLKVQ